MDSAGLAGRDFVEHSQFEAVGQIVGGGYGADRSRERTKTGLDRRQFGDRALDGLAAYQGEPAPASPRTCSPGKKK